MTDSHILQPGYAPTPFSAAEIQAGCPAGRTIRLAVEQEGSKHLRVIRFTAVDADGADQESWEATAGGERIGEPAVSRSSWPEFQAHASFPAAVVAIEEGEVTTPLGTETCLIYRVTGDPEKSVFWFAKERPGMPVKVESQVDGKVVYSMVMVEDEIS
ncbi:MAG: hypothetical protein ACR2OI_07850 [Acidimicrobiia bacterium]